MIIINNRNHNDIHSSSSPRRRRRRGPRASSRRRARGSSARPRARDRSVRPISIGTKILDFGGFSASIILMNCKGWMSHVHRGFPRNLESTKLSSENLSSETGRIARTGDGAYLSDHGWQCITYIYIYM